MKKNQRTIIQRKEFVKRAITNKKEAAATLRRYADLLENSFGTTDRVQIVSEILFISESTIFKDLTN